ncbi:MAG: alpha/beta fold hydrolase [Aeromicrobium sp.]
MTTTPPRRTRHPAALAAVVLVLATVIASFTGPATADPLRDPRSPSIPATEPTSTRAPAQTHAHAAQATMPRTYGRVDSSDRRAMARRGLRLVECDAAPDGGYCGTIHVPLDRAHPARGTVRLFFLYYRHTEPGSARSAIMLSEGGPGYSVTNTVFEKQAYLDSFGSLMAHRDLVMLDQRGVGRSGVIRCPALQRDPAYGMPSILRKVAACARQLGRTATLYGSGDVALDMEAVRRALDVDKLDLYGASYAAQDVQSYAARFPGHVRSAVLDSPFSASVFGSKGSAFDDFGTDLAQAVPEVADRLCARSTSCSAERPDARGDLAWLTSRLRSGSVTGSAYGYGGELRDVEVTESSLAWNILQSGDFGQTALSEVAAAADSLRVGDAGPLLRLAAEAETPQGGEPDPARIFSEGDNPARYCMDVPHGFPWDTDAPVATRMKQWEQALADLPDDQFGMFSKEAWVARPPSPFAPDVCIVWPGPRPTTPKAVPAGARFPAKVPALIITGDLDLNLPPADSEPLRELWPNSRYVEIRNANHHVFFAAFECAQPIIVRFIRDLRPGDTSCAKTNPETFSFPAAGRFPVVAADAVEAVGEPGDLSTAADRQVATVATAAVTDAFRRAFGPVFTDRGRGLRGGRYRVAFEQDRATMELKQARFASDVAVKGTAKYLFPGQELRAKVSVDGPGPLDGTLRITGVWFGFGVKTTVLGVRGTLGGRHVSLTVPGS